MVYPGVVNRHFSGHLPLFVTSDVGLRRIYYMSALTVLCCERSQFRVSPRDFLTLSDRPGKQYFWDASMMAVVWALLEPEGMKMSLRAWLSGDLLHAYGLNMTTGAPMGPTWYAFSATNVFNTALTYIEVTGDRAFLEEDMPSSGKSVLWRLDDIAMLWKEKVRPGQILASFGGNGNLLESGAPTYLGAVASLNAQSVGMMRDMARLHRAFGNNDRAGLLDAAADALLPAVLALYKPGEGVWFSMTDDGQRVEHRHVVDFIYVSQALASDIPPFMRREMRDFVQRELMMKNWLRAQSLKDPGARASARPDHGPMGSYDGWVALSVAEMARLGDKAGALAFLRRTAVSTREGPYAQAHEFCGPDRMADDAPICVAIGPTLKPFEIWTPSRGQTSGGYSSRECIAGGAFACAILSALFGLAPNIDGRMLTDQDESRPVEASLRNLRFQGKMFDLVAGRNGVVANPSLKA